MLEKVSLFKPHFTDRFMQKLGHVFPAHLPERMKTGVINMNIICC